MSQSYELVTIGLTTFNASHTIERAFRSAMNQCWNDVEIIIVDDASSDDTVAILNGMCSNSRNVKILVNSENVGVAASRNRILEEAKGEFVVFFDDDDESDPSRIARQINRIKNYEAKYANGNMVICHAARKVHYPNGNICLERTMGQNQERPAPSGIRVAERILMGAPLEDGNGACPACSQMSRLSSYIALGGFDSLFRRGEDTEFNVRFALSGGHFVGIEEPLVYQFMTKTSDKSLDSEYAYMVKILEKHRPVLERHGQFQFCVKWIFLKQVWLKQKRSYFFYHLTKLFVAHPIHTIKRGATALKNIGINTSFREFHRDSAR